MERIVGAFEDYESYKKEEDKLVALEKQAQQPKQKQRCEKNQGCLIRKNENTKL